MEVKILLGRKIREMRLKLNMTQAQLGELAGVEPKHISCIENGQNYPSAKVISKIAKALNTTIKSLFDFEHLQEPSDLKEDIIIKLDKMNYEQLKSIYKIINTFET